MAEYNIPGETRASLPEIIEILAEQSIAFLDFLNQENGPDIDARRINRLIQICTYVNLESPTFNYMIVPLLQSKGIITPSVLERIESFKSQKSTLHFS